MTATRPAADDGRPLFHPLNAMDRIRRELTRNPLPQVDANGFPVRPAESDPENGDQRND